MDKCKVMQVSKQQGLLLASESSIVDVVEEAGEVKKNKKQAELLKVSYFYSVYTVT
jgi:hypothetical protein